MYRDSLLKKMQILVVTGMLEGELDLYNLKYAILYKGYLMQS